MNSQQQKFAVDDSMIDDATNLQDNEHHRFENKSGTCLDLQNFGDRISLYELNLNACYRCCDHTRPLPMKEDTVIYMKKSGIGLAHVHEVNRRGLEVGSLGNIISGQTLKLETIPSCRGVIRLVEEVYVVDRAFTIGDTVIKFENNYIGNPEKEHLCIPRFDTDVGQIINMKVRGDVLMMPRKNVVVKNVPLEKIEYTEMVNYNTPYNFVLYKDWIGNAYDCVNEVTLLYRGRYRFVVREGRRSGVLFCREDRSDKMKALFPGECVAISINDALGRFATWEQTPPRSLTSSTRRRAAESIKCIIEKIDPHTLMVNWITSPSSTTSPPKVIPKSEIMSVVRIEPWLDAKPSTCDRLKIVPDDLSTVTTLEEYFSCLSEQFRSVFRKLLNEEEYSFAHCETCSKSSQKDLKRKSSISKGSKMARMSHATERNKENCSVSSRTDANGCVDSSTHADVCESSSGSIEEYVPNCGRSKIFVGRSLIRQKRRRYRIQRRKCKSLIQINNQMTNYILNNHFIGEVLLRHTLVDVQWMNGTIEHNIPGNLLISYDPDLDMQDHLPGVIVARKGITNSDNFGVIQSTDCAERSCVVTWFERKEDNVRKVADEKCILFDIMAHPTYKRLFIGDYGVSVNYSSDNMTKIIFQVIANLKNGKQLVRFLDGTEQELWPFDILPIHFMEESLDNDDDSCSMSDIDSSNDSTLFSVTLDDAQKELLRFDVSDRHTSEGLVLDQKDVERIINVLIEAYPQLEVLSSECSKGDGVARNAGILFAGIMLDASGKECGASSRPLVRFANVMTAVYRSRRLPDNFDIQLLSDLIDAYKHGNVALENFYPTKTVVESVFYLDEAVSNARNYPGWLLIFHCISELLRGHDHNSLRLPLRSKIYTIVDSQCFLPRYMSWGYVLFIADEIRIIHDIIRRDQDSVLPQMKANEDGSVVPSSNKQPTVTLTITASTKQLINGIDYVSLATTILTQILAYDTWPIENVNLIINQESKFLDRPLECGSNSTLQSTIKEIFAAALVILKKCGIISRIGIDRNSIWDDLKFFFNESYKMCVEVDYASLHEFIMFVRSVDVYDSSVLQRIIDFTRMCSFDLICLEVMRSYLEKAKEVGNYEIATNLPAKDSMPNAIYPCKKGVKGTFEILDELVDAQASDANLPIGKKFYSTVFKEHKMLSEHLPDNIHVHAFGDRLNILHVLIIGPEGTPFENVPFFFKFKLPSDYPLKPPDVTYVAYSQEQLNPNLYQDGKVCTSLLGTWSGEGVETWIPMKSNLYQVLLSIQALVLVPEPYFNEAGYESRKEQKEMCDRSRRYNEMATINSLEYLYKIYMEPPSDFKDVIRKFVRNSWPRLHSLINGWISGSAPPLFPVMNSEGFKIALEKANERLSIAVNSDNEQQMANEEPMEVVEQVTEEQYEWRLTWTTK